MAKVKFLEYMGDSPPPKKSKPPPKKKKPKKKLLPLKSCPKCGTKHRKPGEFCSRVCSNSRTWSEADKQKKREGAFRYYAKPESIHQREAVAYQNTLRHADEVEDVDMLPYVVSSDPSGNFTVDNDGDVWEDAER